MNYVDGVWWSNEGLRLHYRDYPGPSDRPPIVCLPGLTRNARDFDNLASALSPGWRVVLADLRGRGESGYAKDSMTYVPLIYAQDIERLFEELNLSRAILFGTSLGGIVTMLIGATRRDRLAGALFNDVGPVIEPAGLDRIRGSVGRGLSWLTWVHAARGLEDIHGAIYPDYELNDWLAMAKRLCRLTAAGRIVTDYDPRIAEPFRLPGGEAGVDLWPTMDAFADVPTLIVRGERSDVLSAKTADAMIARLPSATLVTVPRIGHAPTLDEPETRAAIDTLLARIA